MQNDSKPIAAPIRALSALAERIVAVTAWIAAITVIVMCLHVSASALLRSLFNVTLPGTVEIVMYYYMVLVAFLPWSMAQKLGEHVSVDMLVTVLPDRVTVVLQLLVDVFSAAVTGILCWALVSMAIRQTGFGQIVETGWFGLPVWPARWLAALGCGAMVLVLAVQIISRRRLPSPYRPLPEGAA
ncbi:TRAP transporter small permease [Arenibacterium halophilum]|uniref:TRAP transporter small permease protein n=1 Tax=Arenibacterium halophilum TaxID=2583821 RepID=A0ABY2XD68_9RHOB|nr:TRAP transporter small permease [Arenibacterium halophilum]TMV14613.1 TRAP transporter small permease [Arenibacterium halophilum]